MDERSWSILFKVSKHNVRSDGYIDLSPAEIDYLLQFPVYDLHVNLDKQKEAFGPLANWFISATFNEARTQAPFSPPVPTPRINKKLFNVVGPSSWPEATSLSDSFASGTATERNTVFSATMRSIHMYEVLKHCFAHSDWWYGNRPASAMLPRRTRTVRAIPFGNFRPQQIIMPVNASDSVNTTLSALDIQGPTPTLDLDLVARALAYGGPCRARHYHHSRSHRHYRCDCRPSCSSIPSCLLGSSASDLGWVPFRCTATTG